MCLHTYYNMKEHTNPKRKNDQEKCATFFTYIQEREKTQKKISPRKIVYQNDTKSIFFCIFRRYITHTCTSGIEKAMASVS
jgi:hypothetical protein